MDQIELAQKQARLFFDDLTRKLNPKNKLYKLRELINWSELEEDVSKLVNVSEFGRTRKSIRLMLGVSMLQAMYNFSDSLASEEIEENLYWQYFCGYNYAEHDITISESSIRRFRNILGDEGYNMILQELAKVGLKVGAYKKKDLDSVIIDTTVQIKNIKHPHDAYLLEKAREELVKLCHSLGLKLNDTYALVYKRDIIKLWKYKDDSKAKKRKKIMKHMKTLLGRLIRLLMRNSKILALELSKKQLEIFKKVQNIYAQSFLNKKDKEEYKAAGNKVLYSFHAPEVECIGKGKLNKPYEFGNKVGLVVTGRNSFILGVKSFHGNPYDGHTLAQTIEEFEKTTKEKINKAFVDLGYRGNNFSEKSKVYTPYTKKQITPEIKAMQKRRSAIEPVIGHLKNFGRMGRNYLKGVVGDIINPLISAIGFNLRNIANHVTFST
ncbi:MAG: IS5 family transposase [Pseudomonadota bacterium]